MRIRWKDNGYGGLVGYVGTVPVFLFQISPPDDQDSRWMLQTGLPGFRFNHRRFGATAGELQAVAQMWLAAWIAMLAEEVN